VITDGKPPDLYRANGLDCDVPTFANSRFAGFDAQVKDMLDDWNIGSATLAVSNECATIYEKGYGRTGPWWLRNATPPLDPLQILGVPTPANTLFRIASVTKPITAAAIDDLAERNLLNKDDSVFCVPGGPANCILTVDLPANFDQRIGDITVLDLIGHRGGFDSAQQTDYLFRAWETYQAKSLTAPPTPTDFTEYMLSLGLDNDPGDTYAYSNLGYLILGLVIEKKGGLSYRDYVYQRLMAPLGIPSADVQLSRTKRAQRDPREPAYRCIDNTWNGNVPISTFPGEAGQRRCWADGGWVLESMAAHGGLSMTASAVATFYAHWWNFGNRRTTNTYWNFPDPNAVAYSHYGRLAATQTVAARCTNGLNVVLLTNQHAWATFDFDAVEQRLCAAAGSFLAQGPYYSTIWVKDPVSAWQSHRATPAAEYQSNVDALRQAGYRLVDVNGYRTGGATYYAHTWVRNTAGIDWAATHGHDFAGFSTRYAELRAAGYRMERVSGWDNAGTPRYASVWVANPQQTNWITHVRMTHAQYQQRVDEYDSQGYRLISVDGYEYQGQPRYAAVWIHDPGSAAGGNTGTPYRAIHGASAAAYQAFFDQAVDDDYRLTDKDVFTIGGNVRYAAIATKDGGPDFKSYSTWNFYTYQPKWAALKADGWRPVSIAGYR
jgi:CubicO group peptidase (beta-lactamase class C family)